MNAKHHGKERSISEQVADMQISRRDFIAAGIGAFVGVTVAGTAFLIKDQVFPDEPSIRLLNAQYEDRPVAESIPSVRFRGDPQAKDKDPDEWRHVAIVGMPYSKMMEALSWGWSPAAVRWPVGQQVTNSPYPQVADLGSWQNIGSVGSESDTVGIGFFLGPENTSFCLAGISGDGNVSAPWPLRDFGIHTTEEMAKNFPKVGVA